jgi:hypothetical protein
MAGHNESREVPPGRRSILVIPSRNKQKPVIGGGTAANYRITFLMLASDR